MCGEAHWKLNGNLKGHIFWHSICNTQYWSRHWKRPPSTLKTCLTPGEQIIKHFLKFLSRNCWYCAESITQAAWPAHRQSYRRAYSALRHISHRPFNLLCAVRMKYSADVRVFCFYVIQIIQMILTVETSVRKKSHESCRTVLRMQVPCGSFPSKSSLAESWRSFRIPVMICVNLYVYHISHGEM